jgi:hypothetical protein
MEGLEVWINPIGAQKGAFVTRFARVILRGSKRKARAAEVKPMQGTLTYRDLHT